MANFLNQDIIITGLPAGCVGHDIHFTGFRGTDIIVLGKCSKPSYLPEIQIWLVSGYSRLIESRKKNESLQHKSTRWRCGILGRWTTIASSKTWVGSATNMWTRCPRQAWPRGSLIIKHYRVQEGNHNRGHWSPCIRHALKKELLLLEQINQWLGVLGYTYGMKMISLTDHIILRTCMTDLGWFQRKQKKLSQIHGCDLHQMHMN